YAVLEPIGQGSTGIVYKARRTVGGKLVALKVLRSDVRLGSRERARFRSEGEALARLRHANVVEGHEVGEGAGRPFLILEFVAGGSLAQRVSGDGLSVEESTGLVATLARALQYVHDHGVLHRDLNPANVLLAPDGTPKVTDFGLAKVLSDCSIRATAGGRD